LELLSSFNFVNSYIMKYTFIVLFLSLCLSGCKQPVYNSITIGTIDNLYSPTLQEDRKIWVHVPNGTGEASKDSLRYPVVYLLDGDAHFYSVMGMIHQLSEINGNTICPDMIIVGIPNTDRTRDLTPTHVSSSIYGNFNSSGGGEKFTNFMEKELMPYIDSHYPTAPYKILIGHSFGGLLVVNTLVNHPDLFNAYVAIDPSLWWDDQKILKEAKVALEQHSFSNRSLFLAIANTMADGMDTLRVAADTAGNTLHIRSNLIFAKYLSGKPNNGLAASWKYYGTDNHGSVPLIAEYDALHFLFDYYKMPAIDNPDLLTIELLRKHYQLISDKLGYFVSVPESQINSAGYYFLQKKMFNQAYKFFKYNIDQHPASSNVYDSMGDYYIAINDNKNAIEFLTKALSVKDVPETKEKLEKLKSGK
jgi:predicted alpha/beta superfamily hydrolase